MILVLMYHRIDHNKWANSYKMMKDHLKYISKHYPTVFPGDPIIHGKTQICLTFDDAYFDFYHYIFPLLKEFHLKALLAVPVALPLEKCDLPYEKRLTKNFPEEDLFSRKECFCTWEEIHEMSLQGNVEIASHGYTHKSLLDPKASIDEEVVFSKKVLQEKIGKEISSFVYPYGKFDDKIHSFVKKHYRYVFRIGTAINFCWNPSNQILYRIPSDLLRNKKEPFRLKKYFSYFCKYFLNKLRNC
jgi:peptidoglycan/xylan/chitin deacetylase (PgdA/CDA1 family)